ncbi:MAG TPA: P-II family nitrogen regulator [Methanothrix sp.]|nr:P-II family nitrogen regulator [Methanothrix sp.]
MKEVMAIIQMNKMESTKDALDVIGIPSITVYKATGRGKQRACRSPIPPSSSNRIKRA